MECDSFEHTTDGHYTIPALYTCDGDNISPHLTWTYQEADTPSTNKKAIQSYVLIVDDPDAKSVVGKTFVHWIVLLPSSITELPKNISSAQKSSLSTLNSDARELVNDSKLDSTTQKNADGVQIKNETHRTSYYGPCPPHGTHTYQFTLFATTTPVKEMNTDFFKSPFTAEQFRKTMEHAIQAEAQLQARYTRQSE